ncbi:hypothetical protein AB205_0125700, partial [Aquarana catesbeiana]
FNTSLSHLGHDHAWLSAWHGRNCDREKRIGTSEDTSNPTLNEERQLTTHPEDVDADVQEVLGEVVEMVPTTGDVDVVEEETHFSSASAQILIR